MKCTQCGYGWDTKSKLPFVTCPACLQKTRNINVTLVQKVKVVEPEPIVETNVVVEPEKEGISIKCKKCGWETRTTSERAWITCSSCQTKIKNDRSDFAIVQGVDVENKLRNLKKDYEQWVEELKADWDVEADGEFVETPYEEWLHKIRGKS